MGLVQNIFCWNLAVNYRALVLTNMADDDYDMEVERDPDEPEYYQAKEADFVSQVFEDSKKNESKSDEEPEPESELESEDVNLRDYRLKGQVCLQVLIPDWICNLFSMKMENPKTLAYCILALLFPAILAIIASFSEDKWYRTKGQQIYVLSLPVLALCGLLGCWILASAISEYKEDEEFEAKVRRIGLWELKETKGTRSLT